MKLIKSASGKTKIKMSRQEWTDMGKKAGWLSKQAGDPSDFASFYEPPDNDGPECSKCDVEMENVGGGEWECPQCKERIEKEVDDPDSHGKSYQVDAKEWGGME